MVAMTHTLRDHQNQHYYSRSLRPRPFRLGLAATSTGKFGCSSKSGRGAWRELNEPVVSILSRSVVSIASFIGDTMLLERTGICIQTSCANATSFLTSASLGPRTADGKISDDVTIKVRLPNKIVTGKIEHESVFFDCAVVKIEHVAGFHATHLDHDIPFSPYRKVVAVWRSFRSGLLMATSGVELGSPAIEPYKTMLSTCQINTAGIGGPLVDFDGNFVGMNSYPSERKMTPFIQRVLILQLLGNLRVVSMGIKQRIDGTREARTSDLQKNSTPGNSSLRALGTRVNSFEDVFDDDIWGELPKLVASRITRSVVSLASFDGDAPFFACTGFVTDCNASSATILTSASLVRVSGDVEKINTNLRIEVCLRNGFRVIGILKDFNLSFNAACIEIMGNWNLLPVRVDGHISCEMPSMFDPRTAVIAVGCLFDGFKIMATGGLLLGRYGSKLDCPDLYASTCKITKAGVGGPLFDTLGNFLGMNFYHHEETPFLPADRSFLHGFAKSRFGLKEDRGYRFLRCESVKEKEVYRWPLPKSWPDRQPPKQWIRKRVKLVDFMSL